MLHDPRSAWSERRKRPSESPLFRLESGRGLLFVTQPMEETSEIQRIAFLGDYLPRKCGIATFTSDLLAAVAAEYPKSQCFAVPVNDIEDGYDYPDVVRFEIEEQDLASYQRAADFLNIGNVEVVWGQQE